MGAITDQKQDEQDAQELRELSAILPAYSRLLPHHLRNSLSVLLGSLEMLERKSTDGMLKEIYIMKQEIRHMVEDITRAGI